MEDGQFNLVYLDRRAPFEATQGSQDVGIEAPSSYDGSPPSDDALDGHSADLAALKSVFPQVHVRTSVESCVKTCAHLGRGLAAPPTVIVIQTTHGDSPVQTSKDRMQNVSPKTMPQRDSSDQEQDDSCGLALLQHVQSELGRHSISTACIPVVSLHGHFSRLNVPTPFSADLRGDAAAISPSSPPSPLSPSPPLAKQRGSINVSRYLDAGAADVFASPLTRDRLLALPSIVYRAVKDVTRRASLFAADSSRKKSWCGIDRDPRPYAYLREAMVSGLMAGLCNSDNVDQAVDTSTLSVPASRKAAVEQAIGSWAFCAHDFDEDELIHALFTILKHALQMPALHKWRMSDERLLSFLLATRNVYNSFVLYHNFRHACDVCQALFYFLLRVEALPAYPHTQHRVAADDRRLPLARLLTPFHALTMLVAAIGHDVGHPGVNNLFLVTLNAPLAQLYSDRSVLECFHCAAYTQILRRYWPAAFSDTSMRKYMVNTILATDMGVHAKYMDLLKALQAELAQNARAPDAYDTNTAEDKRDLLCCLLIKCADICNAARPIDIATRWAGTLIDEFANQGDMERELDIPTCLYGGPPVRNDMSKIAMSQIGFMDMFAIPLFEGICDLFPGMCFGPDELHKNRLIWEKRIEQERSSLAGPRASMPEIDVGSSQRPVKDADGDGGYNPRHRPSEPTLVVPRDQQLPSAKTTAAVATATSRATSPSSREGGAHASSWLPQMSHEYSRRSSLGLMMAKFTDSRRSSAASNHGGVPPATAVASMRQLDGGQPEIHDPPPQSSAGEYSSEAGKVPYMTSAVRANSTWTQGTRSSEKTTGRLATTTTTTSNDDDYNDEDGSSAAPHAVDRAKTASSGSLRSSGQRKTSGLSFRFWRKKKKKSRSVDSILACGSGSAGADGGASGVDGASGGDDGRGGDAGGPHDDISSQDHAARRV